MKRLTRLVISGGTGALMPLCAMVATQNIEAGTAAYNRGITACAEKLGNVAVVTYDLPEPCWQSANLFARAENHRLDDDAEGAEAPFFVPPRMEFEQLHVVYYDPEEGSDAVALMAAAGIAIAIGGYVALGRVNIPAHATAR